MAKYSFEFKLKIVQEYLNGKGGYTFLSKKYGVPNHEQLMVWVSNYKKFGEKGLLRIRTNNNYSVQFKKDAIELYLTTEISYRELALELEMTNPSLIASWVRAFRAEGIEGLSKPKGRPPQMKNDKKKIKAAKKSSLPSENKDLERIKELENQVLSLQIQNAFLKEWRSLQVKENQGQTNKQRESSTDSDNNSN
jgi:transposase